LHTNLEFEETVLYCMGFEGYLKVMKGVSDQLSNGIVQKATYCKGDVIVVQDESGNILPECSITQQFFPTGGTNIRNDVALDTFCVITGPNASGKTTYLKTTAINVILCQQFGVGFFSECKIRPYKKIHSYLNIPDTSGRDSLFQAESRRCKDILDSIMNDPGRHFCIFDELYSGTNPKEATRSAHAFMEYLRQFKHVDLFLTTHYVSICGEWTEKGENKRAIENYKMVVEQIGIRNIPTYKIAHGVSNVEGAIGVLTDMDYPKEMIEMITRCDLPNDETGVGCIA
jgi:DNA mismatch repair ATPase MutS